MSVERSEEGAPVQRVLVIGEALIDIVVRPDGDIAEHPGGSPANVALTLGRLGRQVELLTWLGDDDHGLLIRQWLERSNVEVHAASAGARKTPTALARIDDTGSATYEFNLDWQVADTAAVLEDVRSAGIVHTGSIGATLAPGGDAVLEVLRAAKQTALVSYDPNVRPHILPPHAVVLPQVEERVAASDVVKVSDEDVAWLYPGEDIAQVAQRWVSAGPALVVITRGGSGALAVTSAGVGVDLVAPKVEVADTVGAGDSFMGSLIDGLLSRGLCGADAREALRSIEVADLTALITRCMAVAAITVSRAGANPPWLAELA